MAIKGVSKKAVAYIPEEERTVKENQTVVWIKPKTGHQANVTMARYAAAGKDVGDVKDEGLKTILIRQVKAEAKSKLDATDWYVTRKSEEGTAIPSAITTHRKAVRTKQAEMETAITNAADTAALETLYKRGDNNERPLGDLPNLE